MVGRICARTGAICPITPVIIGVSLFRIPAAAPISPDPEPVIPSGANA
jgi:hypothetical protein